MFHTEKVSRYNMICFFTVLDQFPIIAVLEYFVEYVVKFSAQSEHFSAFAMKG
jgi:hypothetical protein